jgi:hypothetical protein
MRPSTKDAATAPGECAAAPEAAPIRAGRFSNRIPLLSAGRRRLPGCFNAGRLQPLRQAGRRGREPETQGHATGASAVLDEARSGC